MRSYNLMPNDSHKSFYEKAVVTVYDDGTEVLRSYATDVIRRNADGTLTRSPCDCDGFCHYDAQYNRDCEYWCGAEEPYDYPDEQEE